MCDSGQPSVSVDRFPVNVSRERKRTTMAKKASVQSVSAVPAKSAVPAPAKPTKAPPIVPAKPGKGETGGNDPSEKKNRVPMDVFIARYLESQADPNMTWDKFAEKYSMNVGTCQVALQNAKNMLRKLGHDKEQILVALPPFKSREHGSRESTGNALKMLLGRLSDWNAGSK